MKLKSKIGFSAIRQLLKALSNIDSIGKSHNARIFFTWFQKMLFKDRFNKITSGDVNPFNNDESERLLSSKGTLSTSPMDSVSRDYSVPVVYCDGCCLRNGSVEAKGGVSVFWEHGSPYNVSDQFEGNQTNIRAELEAAIRAVQTAIDQGYQAVEIKTDSLFTIKAATEWSKTWQQNGWKTSSGGGVKNQNDVIRLLDLCKEVKVKWTHVRGHAGVPGNMEADALARAAARRS